MPLWLALSRHRLAVASIAITWAVFFFIYSRRGTSRVLGSIATAYRQPESFQTQNNQLCESLECHSPLNLPTDYDYSKGLSSFCVDRFTHGYLENLRNSATQYCSPESGSSLTCFHSQTAKSRTDSFCLGRSATFDSNRKTFTLGCSLRDFDADENARGIPQLTSLAGYWYETGPRVILDKYVRLENDRVEELPSNNRNYTILVKREGSQNPWHSLLEIFSMTMTLDVLRITTDTETGAPLLSQEDFDNTQVVILDSHKDGPYFDLWQLFAKRPTLRLNDITDAGTNINDIIIPLAGASNPIWQGDWTAHSCQASDLLGVFSRRTIDFYNILPSQRDVSSNITITYVDRQESRRLINHEDHLQGTRELFPNVNVKSADFASLPFEEQLRVDQETDILVGVHGAGLTHALFLQPQSVVVEILPSSLNYKGFRNLAGLLGHSYYSAHATETYGKKRDDWHQADVEITKDRFLKLMELAIKSVYNKGLRDSDAV